MGSNDRLSDSSQRIRTTVCGVHPGFKTDGPIMYYDIAFCQLKTPIILDDPKVSCFWLILFLIAEVEKNFSKIFKKFKAAFSTKTDTSRRWEAKNIFWKFLKKFLKSLQQVLAQGLTLV